MLRELILVISRLLYYNDIYFLLFCLQLSTHRLSDPVVACRTRGSNLPQSAANNTTSAAAEPNNYISIPGSGGITAVQQTISSSAPNTGITSPYYLEGKYIVFLVRVH